MKTLLKPLVVLLGVVVAFSSCMNDTSAEDEARQRQEEEAFEALLAEEKTEIDAYLNANPSQAPGGWQEDDREVTLHTIGRTVKTGIRFEVLEVPTEEDDEAYEYELAGGGQSVVYPTVRVNYSVSLLDADEDDEPVQSGENSQFDFATFSQTSRIYTPAWEFSFFPNSYTLNGESISYVGLTENGLKKGSHIRVITPSVWAYGANVMEADGGTIPANSPLVYEFEVLGIE